MKAKKLKTKTLQTFDRFFTISMEDFHRAVRRYGYKNQKEFLISFTWDTSYQIYLDYLFNNRLIEEIPVHNCD